MKIETKIAKNETLICKFNGKRASWANTLNVFEANAIGTVITGNGHSYTCINDNEPAPKRLIYETGYLFEDENGNRYIFDNSAFAIRAIAYNNVDEYAVTQGTTVEAETANVEEPANVEDADEYTEEELINGIESDKETLATHKDPVVVATANYNIALANLDLAKKEQRKADRAWDKLPYDVDEATNDAAVARCNAADKAVAEAEANVKAAEQELNNAYAEAAKIRDAQYEAARKAEREALGAELSDITWEGAMTTAAAVDAAAEAEIELANAEAEIAIVETPTVEDKDEAPAIKAATVENATLPAEGTLPKGNITVNSGADAWATIAPYFPNGFNYYPDINHTIFNNDDAPRYFKRFEAAVHANENGRRVEVYMINADGSTDTLLTVNIAGETADDNATDTNEPEMLALPAPVDAAHINDSLTRAMTA